MTDAKPQATWFLRLLPASLRAVYVATVAHHDQTDLQGRPYINHLRRVAEQTSTIEERTVAWLHDIVEDTAVTLDDLRTYGFRPNIVEAVEAMTRQPGERYDDYAERVLENTLARAVKLCDLLDHVQEGLGAVGEYGDPDWQPPTAMVGHPKLPIYKEFLTRL